MFCPLLFSFPRSLVLLKVNPFLVPLVFLTFDPKNSCGLFCNHIRLSNSLPGVPSEWFFPSLLKDFLRVGPSLGIFGCFVLFPFRIFMKWNILIFGLVCSHNFSTSVRYLGLFAIHSDISYCNENVLRVIIKIQVFDTSCLFLSPISYHSTHSSFSLGSSSCSALIRPSSYGPILPLSQWPVSSKLWLC